MRRRTRSNTSREDALWKLDLIRNDPKLCDPLLNQLRSNVADCRLTLEEIGTNELELETLRIEGHKLRAKSELERLRGGGCSL